MFHHAQPGSTVTTTRRRTPTQVRESDLARALAWRGRLVAVSAVAAAITAASIAWRATEPVTTITNALPLLALAGCGVLASLAWMRHQDVVTESDELILAGDRGAPDSSVARAVARRERSLQSPRSRTRLAHELRWQLELAQQAVAPDGGGSRTISTLNPDQRAAMVASAERVHQLADVVEARPVDPRALIELWRAADSSPLATADDPTPGATLTGRLADAAALIA